MYLFKHFSKLSSIATVWQRRKFCVQSANYIERLRKRTILQLTGPETIIFLQNMITNDIKEVQNFPSLYALFLNANGRIVYDLLLYKVDEDKYFVEYDATGVEHLQKHLLMYRLRKNVKIEPLNNVAPWVIFKKYEDLTDPDSSHFNDIISCLKKIDDVITFSLDPRCKYLGIRVVTAKDINLQKSLTSYGCSVLESEDYQLLRYKLGIGEGVIDHPPGNCLPFETNVDLLNGVSFTKGCYIGQELTARSNFVLNIRKRLMPIILVNLNSCPVFPPECNIINEKEQKIGRLRSHSGQHGLALLKYEEALKSKCLKLQGFDVQLKALRPKWWPKNLSSDKNEYIFSI